MDKISLFFNINNLLWNFGNTILGVARIPLAIRTSAVRKKNVELSSHKKSNRCYILGLGPSLKTVDFEKLDGDTIATNRYYKFDEKKQYQPTFYVIVDKAFYGGNAQSEFREAIHQYPHTCMVLNGIYHDWCEKELIGLETQPYYFYMWNGGVSVNRDMSLNRILPAVNNVVHVAILLALHCGYEEIILLGCDFNSFASPIANHCYKDEKSSRLWDLDYELYAYSLAAHTHVVLRKYAEKRGQKIFNGTKGSLLDAYIFENDIINKIYYTDVT